MYNNIQLVAAVHYRNHCFYIYHYPELVAFNWLVIVNSIPGSSLKVGVHWVSSRKEAELWGNRCIDAIYTGKYAQFLEQSKKAGEIPEV
ncbi:MULTISPECIES: hypothetical protein [Nostocales]|uniref:Uncharacterized protein n=2 Tax=Nostocales TaxID=1161 RepID=A0A0C1QYA0_9CYAN|nr:hypothetical protein [Tolypothrix bouteillei]KAF3886494.1 hypothetical protein DA73_0400014150 [Tolypothrix bouteillei VB521301]